MLHMFRKLSPKLVFQLVNVNFTNKHKGVRGIQEDRTFPLCITEEKGGGDIGVKMHT